MWIRHLAGMLATAAMCAGASAAISVGVFDAKAAGGRGYGERGIYQALSEHPQFAAELFPSITTETLGKYDAVVFANVYEPGEQVDGWQQLLRTYVEGGGGVIVTHNCSAVKCPETFPEVDGGIEKYVGQHIASFENHPITFGITAFDTAFGDHRIINPGSAAEVLMRNSVDRPAGVAGGVGQGRVARLGPCIGLSAMTAEEAPVGMEARLLFNSVAWAAGTNPWHLPEYGEVTVGISAGAPAFEQPRPVTAHVTVSVRKPAIAVPLRVALYDEAGMEAAAVEVIAAGRKEPGRGRYLRAEMDVELPTEGLGDGKYIVMAEGEDVLSVEAPVELRGQLMAADRERTLKARAALQNTTSKFHFNQGFEFDWDRATKTRVLKPEVLDAYMARIAESGFDTYDYTKGGIWDDEAHEWLEQVCAAAQKHGLKVWATLTPPSGEKGIAAWPKEKVRSYYYETAERFAHLSLKYPNFVAFTCDDFDYNYALFSPEMMAEMASRWRSINPNLYFLPLIYYGGITEEFMATRGPYIDGVVFHFRAGSNPPSYIDTYDPKSFEMYGDVQRYEFKRIRRIVGDKPLIAGLYIWYYEGGWGVMTPDGKKPSEEHIVRDAVQKIEISHDYAIGTRLYGLGIDHAAYQAMGKLCAKWREAGDDWGEADISDLESDIRKYRGELDNPPYFGTLASRPSSLSEDLRTEFALPHIDLHRRLMETPPRVDPQEAVRRFFCIVVSRSGMRPAWGDLLQQYVEAGGTMIVESVPGWTTDLSGGDSLNEWEAPTGDRAPGTLKIAELSGILFTYHHRGAVKRVRLVEEHPLTVGLRPLREWLDIPYTKDEDNYTHLAYPVKGNGCTVLVEGEHETCRYDGISYKLGGTVSSSHPLVTINSVGEGTVIRHYAANSLPATMGEDRYRIFAANLAQYVRKLYNEHAGQ